MIFRQYQLSCLSLFSYLIGDETTGRAVVVDPQRDVTQYLADAEELGLRIERVVETHFHADFVSGHLELAAAVGAVVSYAAGAVAEFPITTVADGERLSLGEVELEFRHTPGHTPESMSIVVREHPGAEPWGVLTGDTLFIGDVGRPDLLTSIGHTAEDLARQLYHSVHTKLLTLPDATRVYPAHGAGSACGKSMSDAVESTIGEQRRFNYALQPMSEERFVEVVTEGQTPAPLYFAFAADTNRRERELLDDAETPRALDLGAVLAARSDEVVLLDCRAPEAFASGHLRGSVNVGIDGRFAEYAGDVIRPGQSVVLLCDPGRETEAKVRLARIGFDKVLGHLPEVEAALAAHPEEAETARRLPANEVDAWLSAGDDLQVVDVRADGEAAAGTLPGARVVPLQRLMARLDELDPGRPTVVYCAGGYRSSVAASVLRANGFGTVADLIGGYDAWAALANSSAASGAAAG